MFTWMHTDSGAAVLRALLGQALRDLQPIDRVRPVEVLRHHPRLVALDRADAVPGQGQVGQQRLLLHGLLDVVFAERSLARCMGLAHCFGAESLGHGKQRDFVHVALRSRAGARDPAVHGLEVGSNRRHNGPEAIGDVRHRW
jgi:hypothetical protein